MGRSLFDRIPQYSCYCTRIISCTTKGTVSLNSAQLVRKSRYGVASFRVSVLSASRERRTRENRLLCGNVTRV